jgi:hypothetical protein
MTTTIQLLFAASLLMMVACGGEDDPQPLTQKPPVVVDTDPATTSALLGEKVFFISESNTLNSYKGTSSFAYDSKGRLTEVIFTNTNYSTNGYKRFEYTSTSVTMKYREIGYDFDQVYVYTLNGLGLATAVSIDGTPQYTYKYDNAGHMIEKVELVGGLKETYTYSEGDAALRVVTRADGSQYTSVYSHYTDKENSLDDMNYGIYFFGKGSKTQFKQGRLSEYEEYHSDEGTYQYAYDTKGRAVERKEIYDQITYNEIIKYTE